jgi:hypothetical protein
MDFTEKEFRYLVVVLLCAIWLHASFWTTFVLFLTLPMVGGALNGLTNKWNILNRQSSRSASSKAANG